MLTKKIFIVVGYKDKKVIGQMPDIKATIKLSEEIKSINGDKSIAIISSTEFIIVDEARIISKQLGVKFKKYKELKSPLSARMDGPVGLPLCNRFSLTDKMYDLIEPLLNQTEALVIVTDNAWSEFLKDNLANHFVKLHFPYEMKTNREYRPYIREGGLHVIDLKKQTIDSIKF